MKNAVIKKYGVTHLMEIAQPGTGQRTSRLDIAAHKIECTLSEARDLANEILNELAEFEQQTGIKVEGRKQQ